MMSDQVLVLEEGLDPAEYIIATYLIQGPGGEDILARATGIATEQTVGRGTYKQPHYSKLVDRAGGRLVGLYRVPDHEMKFTRTAEEWQRSIVRIAFPAEMTGYQIPMLLTVLLGDISLGGVIKLIDVELPSNFINHFKGPKFGQQGIRERVSSDRPLVCSILKPCVGLSADEAADIFYQHCMGGTDVIKDDELMAYSNDLKVEDRVRACMAMMKRAYETTGHEVLYLTSITDRPDRMMDNARRAIDAGANALMLTPLTTGIGALEMLAESPEVTVPIFAHPALLGAMSWSPDFGIAEHILMAKLVRLAGADINAFPVPYGKFAHLREGYIKLFNMSHAPMGHIKPSFSQTGGGLNPCNVGEVVQDLGNDIMLVVGGSIQEHPMGLAAGVKAVRQAVSAVLDSIPLEEAARSNPELGAAYAIWGKK